MDDSAFRLLLLDRAKKALACGWLHFNAPDEVQVRFMAVDRRYARSRLRESYSRGIGSRGSAPWRSKGRANARDNATEFYARHGYAIVGDGEMLFGVIRHVRGENAVLRYVKLASSVHNYALIGVHLPVVFWAQALNPAPLNRGYYQPRRSRRIPRDVTLKFSRQIPRCEPAWRFALDDGDFSEAVASGAERQFRLGVSPFRQNKASYGSPKAGRLRQHARRARYP
jgi:hypothetical protein